MIQRDEYLNLRYKPRNDLVCLFRVEPGEGLSIKEAAEKVAAESSTGTWTKLQTEKDYMKHLRGKVYSIKGHLVKIAYPAELFEKGNVPNILSSVAGNIFGMKAVKNLRLEDISFPKSIISSYKGPRYGIKKIRKIMKVKDRPLLGTIIKPKLGLNAEDHAKSAYEAWIGGCDFVKDDENLASQSFNRFESRLSKTLEMQDKAREETGEEKAYFANVTAETEEMVKRAELVRKQGGKYIMVDMVAAGFSALQTLRENTKLIIHAHRAMHAALTRNTKHGVRMIVLADFARLIGVDQLHIGTGIGKLEGNIQDIVELEEELEKQRVRETQLRLAQNWYRIKPVLGVCSGGLHPGNVRYLMRHLGRNIVIQAGGGIHGHPKGTIAGARAMRLAIESVMHKKGLEEEYEAELRMARKYWGK
ncbi:MAG: type III ribulose-bisphosphate carboxylase [archaeon]